MQHLCGLTEERPAAAPSSPETARDHWTWLVILAVFLLLPALLSFEPQEARVKFAGHPLPPSCLSLYLLDAPCPGCGMSRAFTLVTRARFAESLRYHRLGLVLYVWFVLLALYRVHALVRLPRPVLRVLARAQRIAAPILIGLLILNWMVGLATGSN